MMTKEKFGQWVKEIRNECGYTQHKLAELLDFKNSQSIANIESGRAMLPKYCYLPFIKLFRLDPKLFIDAIVQVKQDELRQEVSDIVYGKKVIKKKD